MTKLVADPLCECAFPHIAKKIDTPAVLTSVLAMNARLEQKFDSQSDVLQTSYGVGMMKTA